jgi:hypothetical protein
MGWKDGVTKLTSRLSGCQRLAARHPVNDGVVIRLKSPHEVKKLMGVDVMLFEKCAIPATAVHQGRWQFTAEFGPGFGQQTGEPRNATDGRSLGGQGRGIEGHRGGTRLLRVVEIIAADELNGVSLIVTRLTVTREIVDVIVKVLCGDAVGREECRVGAREQRGGSSVAARKAGGGSIVNCAESSGEIVMIHKERNGDNG